MVEALEKDEDGEPITTMVVDWLPPGTAPAPSMPDDPWARPKRQDQRTAVMRLRRVLMAILAEQGVELPIPPDGPIVRMGGSEARSKGLLCLHTGGGDTQTNGRSAAATI
jgi:hypothetical protein